ncbi:hypothetical protein DPMN_105675 [Dreissena polymorpha]|uniref:Uncharacterized protein n=1 Tax=Dreissena polymorpha TaxID=45954 RepID=A0A9D4K3L1_DREPO|nr:hypothetical protein DPMN_105675 [Dreissena polymorpha]
MNDIVMARTSLFRQPASQPASQPARIRQSNNQFFPSENLVKKSTYGGDTPPEPTPIGPGAPEKIPGEGTEYN